MEEERNMEPLYLQTLVRCQISIFRQFLDMGGIFPQGAIFGE